MSRARCRGYRFGLQWIVDNDDVDWLTNDDPMSVSAVFLADLFGKTDDEVRTDLLGRLQHA